MIFLMTVLLVYRPLIYIYDIDGTFFSSFISTKRITISHPSKTYVYDYGSCDFMECILTFLINFVGYFVCAGFTNSHDFIVSCDFFISEFLITVAFIIHCIDFVGKIEL